MGRHKTILTDLSDLKRSDETILADEESLNQTIKWIKDILYAKTDLVALSAPQININKRLFCIKFSNGDIRTFINPMIAKGEGMHFSRENNISLPNKEFILPRYEKINVCYQTPTGKIESNILESPVSDVFQQMTDLLDGITLETFGLPVLKGWDEATDEEREEVLKLYAQNLEEYKSSLQKEIEETPELKQLNDAIDFMAKVQTGEIQLEEKKPHLNYKQRRLLKKLERKIKKRLPNE